MTQALDSGEAHPISEMSIVDTFTRLIFEEEGGYSRDELAIIQALRMVEINVLADSHREMGAYLQALEVREMIELVARVRHQLAAMPGVAVTPAGSGPAPPGAIRRA